MINATDSKGNNVTLLLEKQHKELTSNKAIYPLQFEIIFNSLRLSLTFKY